MSSCPLPQRLAPVARRTPRRAAPVLDEPTGPARLLVIPGLHDSGPAHWQTWLQGLHRDSVRVVQDDWERADLEAWATRIEQTLREAGPGPWLAVAHSFGCLALAHVLGRRGQAWATSAGLQATLLVAPADPHKFDVATRPPTTALPLHGALIASESDPWMRLTDALGWAQRWGLHAINLGDAGHINAEAGYGPLPVARRWVAAMHQRQARAARPARERALVTAQAQERGWSLTR